MVHRSEVARVFFSIRVENFENPEHRIHFVEIQVAGSCRGGYLRIHGFIWCSVSEWYGHAGPGVRLGGGQTKANLSYIGLAGLASVWRMARWRFIWVIWGWRAWRLNVARRRQEEYRSNVDALLRCMPPYVTWTWNFPRGESFRCLGCCPSRGDSVFDTCRCMVIIPIVLIYISDLALFIETIGAVLEFLLRLGLQRRNHILRSAITRTSDISYRRRRRLPLSDRTKLFWLKF